MLVLSFGAIWSNPRTEKGTHMNHITPPIINRKKASDFPQDLLNMLDGYVHGRLNRREFRDSRGGFVSTSGWGGLAPLLLPLVTPLSESSSRE